MIRLAVHHLHCLPDELAERLDAVAERRGDVTGSWLFSELLAEFRLQAQDDEDEEARRAAAAEQERLRQQMGGAVPPTATTPPTHF